MGFRLVMSPKVNNLCTRYTSLGELSSLLINILSLWYIYIFFKKEFLVLITWNCYFLFLCSWVIVFCMNIINMQSSFWIFWRHQKHLKHLLLHFHKKSNSNGLWISLNYHVIETTLIWSIMMKWWILLFGQIYYITEKVVWWKKDSERHWSWIILTHWSWIILTHWSWIILIHCSQLNPCCVIAIENIWNIYCYIFIKSQIQMACQSHLIIM